MKNTSKILILLLIFSMILSLAACQKKEASDDEGEIQEEIANEGENADLEGTTLNIVATSESYKEFFDKFTDETGIKVEFISMSSGELLSRVKAEEGKPMADIWFGGGLDAFMEAKEEGLLESYISKESEDIPAEFKDPEGYWIGKGLTIVGLLVNKDILEENNLPMPTSWKDLTNPVYKDEIIMSNPAISGTNYAAVNGLLQMMGEEEGWKFFEELDKNIPYYAKRGKDPQLKTMEGEFAIGIIPADKSAFDLQEEQNVEVVFPEDGIPWVPEGVAIFKNSQNLEGAKAFIDFMLSKENQQILAQIDGKDGAQMVKPGVEGYDLGVPEKRFIKQDLSSFGKDREPILERWSELVGDK
ncbi:ABC transporter, substrate-binding protein [[Clostridium] ultunense Esp]|uniref:ABC transporter, substrate-binding protein n=1 Tax=[Clostridium] ultunense Esp TaxID=1288971 RepID=M1Z7B7_9FIRM|nr:ABC transporter substrate-binding protein [Schnuerera ultunensis]CCQ93926.1 ABC transporter, substrate-binding protein [[Clostridium] ultunense Esp]SHD77335.1 ABC transporter, substrate-binding protein [[Clostridium] ultunense Esp]